MQNEKLIVTTESMPDIIRHMVKSKISPELNSVDAVMNEVATTLGFAKSTVRSWVYGQRTPTLDSLMQLAVYCGFELIIEPSEDK